MTLKDRLIHYPKDKFRKIKIRKQRNPLVQSAQPKHFHYCLELIIKIHSERGIYNIVAPYVPEYPFPGEHPHYQGALPVTMSRPVNCKGYRLTGKNEPGSNFIFLEKRQADNLIPEVPMESVLQYPSLKRDIKLLNDQKPGISCRLK